MLAFSRQKIVPFLNVLPYRFSPCHFRHSGNVSVFGEPFLAGSSLLHHRGQRLLRLWLHLRGRASGGCDQPAHTDPGPETADRRPPSQFARQCQESAHPDPGETVPSARYVGRKTPTDLVCLVVFTFSFSPLGHSALMCRVDGSHYGDQGLLQKVRKGRGTRVALTASHSSTIVEECIRLIRILHR